MYPGTDTYRAADHTPDGHAEPGVVVYRFDAPLFFANADVLRDDIAAAMSAADPPTRWVVIDMEGVTDVDATATVMLREVVEDAKARGIGLAVARLKGPVATYLERAGLLDLIGRERVFLEVDDAVTALREALPPAPGGVGIMNAEATVDPQPAGPQPATASPPTNVALEEAGRQMRAPWAASIAGLLFAGLFTGSLLLMRSQPMIGVNDDELDRDLRHRGRTSWPSSAGCTWRPSRASRSSGSWRSCATRSGSARTASSPPSSWEPA